MHRMLNTTRIATAPTAIPTTTPVEILDEEDGGDGGDLDEGGVGLRSELGGVLVEGGDGGLGVVPLPGVVDGGDGGELDGGVVDGVVGAGGEIEGVAGGGADGVVGDGFEGVAGGGAEGVAGGGDDGTAGGGDEGVAGGGEEGVAGGGAEGVDGGGAVALPAGGDDGAGAVDIAENYEKKFKNLYELTKGVTENED
ncbi:hypothetical protein TSUD_144440 [Trifolium subterraneum]|uniref:Uncharacterized protein n=1 Tax=Trifolium subterraneum TaxID=3900 RepID=A0A2Z6NL67_TRISU|nr:hypothetical protein TSUD_144440 [Trifolium subterraneum]